MPQENPIIKVARITGKNRAGILAVVTRVARQHQLYVHKRRGFVDFDQATVVLRLVGTPDQLESAEKEMRADLNELVEKQVEAEAKRSKQAYDSSAIPDAERITVSFVDAQDSEPRQAAERMYPLLLRIEFTVPETMTPDLVSVLTHYLASRGIDILSDDADAFEPPGAIGHALAVRNVLGVHVPLRTFVGLDEFKADLEAEARKFGCIGVKLSYEEGS